MHKLSSGRVVEGVGASSYLVVSDQLRTQKRRRVVLKIKDGGGDALRLETSCHEVTFSSVLSTFYLHRTVVYD